MRRSDKVTAAVTMFVIAILLVSSTPIIAQDEGGLRGLEEYSGEHHTVRYHLDAPDGVNSACNDIVNDIGDGNSGDPYVDVVYYGSIVSTEYNPQLWASTIPTREDVDWNWLEIKDYSVGSTAVFIGWHYGWEDSGSTHYPGEVLSKYDLSNAESGILNVYATWSTVDNVQTVTSESSASNIQTAINGFVGGTAYTNFILVRAGDAVNLSGKTLTTGKPVTIRTEPVEGFSSVGRLEGNGSTTVKAGAMLIIDDIGLKISTPDSKHGTTNFGIVGNGYPLIIGTGIMSYYGFGLGDTFGQNTSKGERNGYPTLRGGTTASSNALGGDWPVNVYPARDTASDEYGNIASVLIVHSGTWSNIIGGNSQSVTNGSVYSVLRSVTVLDTYACGGTASNGNYTIKGSTYGYLVNANVVADSYQQRAMGLETIPYKYTPDNAPLPGWPFNIDSNNGDSVLKRVFIYESTVITGGGGSSGTGNVMKNTNVYISGTSTVWDAQAAGRSEKSPVAGTGLIELSGKAVSQHILCGSATDGASSDTKIIDSTRIVVKDSAMAATLCGGGYDTWSAPRGASMMNGGTVEIEVTGGTVCDVFGGGFRALVGTSSKPIDSIAISISGGTVLGNVYGGGSGGLDKMKHVDDKGTPWSDANQTGKSDSTGKSRVYVKDVSIEISDDAHVLGNVYGGGKSVPTISSYYNYSYLSDASLESDVAALYCNSVSISVSGNAEVDGDVFGGGRGVVVPTSSEQEEWTEYTHTLVMTPTGAKYIEWVTKSGSSLEQSCTFLDGNYSGYAKVSIPLTAAASPTVEIDIEDNASARSVYGGGARSKTVGTGNIDIEIKGDASVEDSVFGGGMMESLNAASISIGVSGTADVGSCVYGAGAEGPVVLTGNVYISTSGTGVTIGDSVFGGGFKESLSAMAVSIDIGGGTEVGSCVYGAGSEGEVTLNAGAGTTTVHAGGSSDVQGSVYGGGLKAALNGNTRVVIDGESRIRASVYGGGDIGARDPSEVATIQTLVYGSSYVLMDGAGGASVAMSILGGGNSCGVSGNRDVLIRDYVAPARMESLQSATAMDVVRSTIYLDGRGIGATATPSLKYSLYDIDFLRLMDGSKLGLSQTVDEVREYESCIANGELSTESNPSNVLVLSDGVAFNTGHHIAIQDNYEEYGPISGCTILEMDALDVFNEAYVQGSQDSTGRFMKASGESFEIVGYVDEDGDASHDGFRFWTLEPAVIDSGTCGGGLTWMLDENGLLTISGTGKMDDWSLGEAPWYSHINDIEKVKIGNSVTHIGRGAFYGCTSISSVVIPSSVTSIGSHAFYICTSLSSVVIPSSVESIGECVFAGCTSLSSVVIPSSVTSVGYCEFNGCTSLSSVVIPSSVMSIGFGAFWGCTSLSSVVIPSSVTSIEGYAFYNCTSLSSVVIPSSVTSIGCGAFSRCTSLNGFSGSYPGIVDNVMLVQGATLVSCAAGPDVGSVIVPSSVASIGDSAFYGCVALTSVEIQEGVASIGDSAFYGCVALIYVSIPSSVASIGDCVFLGCTSLNGFSGSYPGIVDNVMLVQGATLVSCAAGPDVGSVDIPSSVTSIWRFAFYGCTSLASLSIPSSVTSIGASAFSGCTSLSSVAIPSSVTSIGDCAFSGCTSLSSVDIKEGVASVEDYAFNCCISLVYLFIPSSMTSIGQYAFSGLTFCGYDGEVLSNVPSELPGHVFLGSGNRILTMAYSVTVSSEDPELCTVSSSGWYLPGAEVILVAEPADGCSFVGWYDGEILLSSDPEYRFTVSGDMSLTAVACAPHVEHSYHIIETVEPTCDEGGHTTYACSCGDSYTVYTEPLGHDYVLTGSKAAACEEDGYLEYVCTKCGDSYRVVTHVEHDYYVAEKAEPTCTEDGYVLYKCSNCEDSYVLVEMPAGHSYVPQVVKRATSTETGLVRYVCSACGESYDVVVPARGEGVHVLLIQDRIPWEEDNDVLLLNRLVSGGYIDGWDIVTTAGASSVSLYDYDVVMIANDQWSSTYASLGAMDSVFTDYASSGGALIYGACDLGWTDGCISYQLPGGVSKIHGYMMHNYVVDSAHPVATGLLTDGKRLTDALLQGTYCSHSSFDRSTLPEGSNVIIVDSNGNPTLVEYPLGDGTVIASGLTWEFYLLRHYAGDTTYSMNVFDDLVVYAVSVAEGRDVHHEHVYSETIVVEPTCDSAGYVKHVCECGDAIFDGYTDPLGHLLGDWVVDEEPTCTHAGSRHAECSRCRQTVVESISALGHSLVFHEGKAPALGVEGWEDYYECTVCGFTTFKAISALGVEIVSISPVDLGILPAGLPFGDLGAPSSINARCAGGSTVRLGVSWDSSAFVSEPGSYLLPGTVSLPDDYYLSEGLSSTVYASYSISSDLSGIADIVFVIDTTGSMSGEISSVKSNIKAFADELYATGMSVRWALVEYRDITHDGRGSTKVVKNGADPWYADVGAYKSAIGRLSVGGGGDTPETVIDGLEAARHLSFRDSAGRFLVVVTDAGYKVDNQYGVPSMSSEISSFRSDSIPVFVVTSSEYYSDYRGLASSTGGKLLNIYGDFSRGLMEIAERIGEFNAVSLRIASMPDTVVYNDGEPFDPTGMVVEAVYGNGAVRTVGSYTVGPSGPLSCGDTHVTVRFGNLYVTVPITVTAPIPEIVSSGICGDDLFWQLDEEGTLTIIGSGSMYDWTPGTAPWYSHIEEILSVVIEGSVTNIGSSAFQNATSMSSAVIPDSVTSINDMAFHNCESMSSLQLPDSLVRINDRAFEFCDSLEFLRIPDGVTHLGDSAFSSCYGLKSVELSCSLTYIGDSVFFNTGLTSVVIPSPVSYIGDYMFSICHSLQSVVMPDSVISIGVGAFSSTALESLSIPSSVVSIGDYAFYSCEQLVSVILPESLTSIGEGAFMDCSSMEYVYIPSGITSMGDAAFSGLRSLDRFGGSYPTIVDGVMVTHGGRLISCAAGSGVTRVNVPSFISSIGYYAFKDCWWLKSADLLDSLDYIGDSAFFCCEALSSISIPSGVEFIGDSAFYNCSSIKSLVIPDSVEYIGNCAFAGSGLEFVTISGSTDFEDTAFLWCYSMMGFSGSYPGIVDGKMLVKDGKLVSYAVGTDPAFVEIPECVDCIGEWVFESCTSLKSVFIPETVTYIGTASFQKCSALEYIDIPNSVEYIDDYAFASCTGIRQVSFGVGLETVKPYAFSGTTFVGLSGSVLSVTAENLSGRGFSGHDGVLTEMPSYSGRLFSRSGLEYEIVSTEPLTASLVGYGVSPVNLSIPSLVRYRGEDVKVVSVGPKAFYGCSTLVTADLGSVEAIGSKAFANCRGFMALEIPGTVKSVGGYAFYGLTFIDISGEALSHTAEDLAGRSFFGSSGVLREGVLQEGTTFTSSGLEFEITSLSPLQATLTGYVGAPASLSVPGRVFYSGFDISVVSVGPKAFYGCLTLTYLDLGSVESVGLKAFANCSKLKTLVVPETLKSVGSYAFYGCGITALDIPGDDVVLEASAFSACKRMTSITFSGTGAVIGTNAFYKNNGVSTVDLSTVASVGQKAFPYCYGLETLVIPGSLLSMGPYAFYGCSNLKGLIVEEGVESIPRSAFSECRALESVSFPASLRSVGANAFYGVGFFTEDGFKITADASNLAGNTFEGSGGRLYFVPAADSLVDGDRFSAGGITYKVMSAAGRTVSIIDHEGPISNVPASVRYGGVVFAVESIGDGAFLRCSTLTSADLSDVRFLGFKALGSCTSIEEIVFGDCLESVGGYALYGLSFYDGATKLSATPDHLRGHAFSGSGGKLYLIS